MSPKHQPTRTCIACREAKEKRALIRVVRSPDGEVALDPKGKANGRGAYLCRKADCWDKAIKRKSLQNALKVELEPAKVQELREAAQAMPGFEDNGTMDA